jgi:general secretion pathway protein J
MRRDRGSECGFILAEALISVALLALMVALVASALALGQRVAAMGLQRDQLAETAAGVTAVVKLLKHASPDRQVRTGDKALVRFDGTAERLSFLTISQGDALPAGLVAVTLTASRGGDALVMDTVPVPVGGEPALDPAERLTLLQGAGSLRFRYLGRPSGAVPQWRDTWRDADRMPHLIALEVRRTSRGRRAETIYLLRPGAD